jgi:hypothetical protein
MLGNMKGDTSSSVHVGLERNKYLAVGILFYVFPPLIPWWTGYICCRVHMLTTTRRRSNSLNLISTQHRSRAQLYSSRPISYTSLSDYKLLGLVFPSINCAELFISAWAPSRTAVPITPAGWLKSNLWNIQEPWSDYSLVCSSPVYRTDV